jgi:hypothetical protein
MRSFAAAVLSSMLFSMPQPAPLVGLWDSATTSTGGIGSTLEFRADGTFVEATTVIVNAYYRVTAGRLVIDERPVGPQAPAAMAVRVEVEGDVLRWTGPDGAMVRKERLGRPEAGKPAIVGAWRYRHDTGTTAFERYTDDGRMFFRLPMKSSVGRYVLKRSELLLTRPSQADVAMKVVLMGDELTLSTNDRTSSYRRDMAGPWYERERISK